MIGNGFIGALANKVNSVLATILGTKTSIVQVPYVPHQDTMMAFIRTGYYHVHGASFIYPPCLNFIYSMFDQMNYDQNRTPHGYIIGCAGTLHWPGWTASRIGFFFKRQSEDTLLFFGLNWYYATDEVWIMTRTSLVCNQSDYTGYINSSFEYSLTY
jgi:hypothetical protein